MTDAALEPQHIVTAERITSLIPGITDDWAVLYQDAVTSVLGELTSSGGVIHADRLPQIELLILNALKRAGQAKPWIEAETIGPYSVRLRNVKDDLFLLGELDSLRRLLQLTPKRPPGGARGSFPAAGRYDRLFVKPETPVSGFVRLAAGAEHVLGDATTEWDPTVAEITGALPSPWDAAVAAQEDAWMGAP